jgi:hypothetical protein
MKHWIVGGLAAVLMARADRFSAAGRRRLPVRWTRYQQVRWTCPA